MSVHVYLFLLMFFLLLSLALPWRLDWLHLQPSHSRGGAMHSIAQRLLKPRTPLDCPACRLASTALSSVEPAPAPVPPWSEVKSRRGAPKRIHTKGFACPNHLCPYFGITDAQIHALVGDGKHGQAERIQTFRGPACHTTFTARRCTPLYRLKTPSQQVAVVLSVLAEGLDASAAERVFGPRTQHMAHEFIHSLRESLAPGCLPLFTSDGLNLYFYALTAHFGQWLALGRRGRNARRWQVAGNLIYGQVKKSYRWRKLVRVTHVMRIGTEAALKDVLQRLDLSGRLNTAFIERVNLTVRHGVAALARRTWATAQQSLHLLAHLEWWRAYYHFVRPHAALRVALVQPQARGGKRLAQRYRQRTPAMAAGRTNRRWTTREVLCYPLPQVPHFAR
jgi:hypothetical protein